MDLLRSLDLPRPVGFLVVGVFAGGVVGAVTGLVVGLIAYPPTAWFAALELGIPAAGVGGLLGLVAWLVARGVSLLRPHR